MWISLPNEVRYKIRSIFSIPRSSNTVVNDGVVETDGTTHQDLQNLTVEKMRDYLKEESTDFHKLFDMVVVKVKNEMNPSYVPEEPIKKKIKKNANA